MKHYIVAKFKKGVDLDSICPDIQAIFDRTLAIEGVREVLVHKSNSKRENRYSVMIEMTMAPEALPLYDLSESHKEWKEKYGALLEAKAIFDCDERSDPFFRK